MNFKHHLETAWRLTLKNIVPLILMTLVMTLVTVFSFGLLGMVVLAGYCQAILLMIRENRTPAIGDLFSQMHLFLPLLVFAILLIIASAIGFSLFYLPGIAVLCAVTFACLYMLPLMTDRKMKLQDAIQQSWQMAVRGNIADHVVVVILYIGFLAIGGSVFLGTLLTQPFATVFVLSVYLERTAAEETPVTNAGDTNPY
ncbi:hypothetical protein [Desulfatitalea alkaliphila]|uniref:Glycerophosphoryl diester phosphodiesterase membrane domain-containing protein n=1 Tax=Desulfatitalea alkaliphila TaxID=2929485 RepID=A0AA41R662_9BACT|nr:hypothetical protein [Desulfatitalea alkaliphila]MCJ8502402.1 hypothetical protein [Desulfatitalea alkaliphila]